MILTKRVFRSTFTVSTVILIMFAVTIVVISYTYITDTFKNNIKAQSTLIAACLNESESSFLSSSAAYADRITLIDTDGTVLFDNTTDADTMENHSDREEFISAQARGVGESTRYSETSAEVTYYYALKLDNGMVVRVSGTQGSLYALFVKTLPPIVVFLLVALALSLILSRTAARKIVEPINEIDPECPDDFTAYDELAPLLNKIKALSGKVDEQITEIQRRQQEFTAITEHMSEGLLMVDKNANVLSCNSAAQRFLGVSSVDTHRSVININRSTDFTSTVEKALSGKPCEYVMKRGERAYRVMANPVFDDDSTVTGTIVVILDVTDSEEADKLRREFTANVSHELKTPLTSISGFAEIMAGGMAKEADMKHFAGLIYSEAQRLITLVNDIIKLSRLDEADTSQEKSTARLIEDADLYSVAVDVAQRLSSLAKKHSVTIEVHGAPTRIKGDSLVLDEMVYNLVENAVKYNVSGGRVDITTAEENGAVKLIVSDTGIGIPCDEQQRVFERFYRVDKSHSKEIGGTGLGLSIVKHAAAYMGAAVELSSTQGEGTTVTVSFHAA